jgi:hypothetical protein
MTVPALMILLVVVGLAFLLGVLPLIIGIVALARINRSGGQLRGRGFAVAAIVAGALMLTLMFLVVPALWFFAGRSPRHVPASHPMELPARPLPLLPPAAGNP